MARSMHDRVGLRPKYSLEELAGRGIMSKRKEGDVMRSRRAGQTLPTTKTLSSGVVTDEDVSRAFALIRRMAKKSSGEEETGKNVAKDRETGIRSGELRKVLSLFFTGISKKEVKLLMGGMESLEEEDIQSLLTEGNIANLGFDPVREVFKVLDPDHGYASIGTLVGMLEPLDLGHLSKDEEERVMKMADDDEDGKIGVDDFRGRMYNIE